MTTFAKIRTKIKELALRADKQKQDVKELKEDLNKAINNLTVHPLDNKKGE